MQIYTLTPNDVLFFRDGRPMEAAGGHGARWPEPSLIFDALHAALHRAFGENYALQMVEVSAQEFSLSHTLSIL